MSGTTREKDHKIKSALPGSLQTVLACLLLVSVLMPDSGQSAEPGEYRLYARPSICVSYDSEAPCTMSMEVSWESTENANVCLKEALEAPALRCWQNASAGAMTLVYADTRDLSYRLVDADSNALLAETDIVIINRDLRDSRKRRRHVWSIL